MAEALDILNKIADDVAAIVDPLVATTYTLPEQIDAATYGATRTVPPTTTFVERPMQGELEKRLAEGKGSISVEADIHDGPSQQYANEGARQDLLERTPLTLTAARGSGGQWTLSGTASVGNVIGVQLGSIGASYAIVGGDTLASIAASLAAACAGANIGCSAAGAVLTLPLDADLNLGTTATYVKAIARRRRNFDVYLWMTNPFDRQYLVRNIESLYHPGQKFAMRDGSEVTVLDYLGALQEDPIANSEVRDGLYVARPRWLMDFTVTAIVTKTQIVATTFTFDNVLSIDSAQLLLASQL